VTSKVRQRVSSGSPLEQSVGYSRAVRVDDRVFVAGTCAQVPDGDPPTDAGDQLRRCLEIISTALDEVGASLDDVVRTRLYLVDPDDFPAVGAVHGEAFGEIRPAATGVIVKALLDPAWKVEIEVEAVIASDTSV
jgi:enamine deaminase RidA (YjgF/YER057c/UK114 family)